MMAGKLFKTVRASAIGYAISFMLLIGLICSGVLFIASANKRIEVIHLTKEHLIFDNYTALLFASKQELKPSHTLVHASGDTSEITTKTWGSFKMLHVTTRHSGKTIQKAALIAYQTNSGLPALYLPDNQQALKIGGETRIEGTAFLSERGIERAYVAGKNYMFEQLIFGKTEKSERTLPPLKKQVENLSLENFIADCDKKDFIGKDSAYSFVNKTTLFSEMGALTLSHAFSGNVIIHSFDSIYVTRSAKLKNVILIAPRIRFEEGFKGSVQAIAHQSIVCEKNVRLDYPSTLTLNEIQSSTLGEQAQIFLDENSKVLGGVLVETQQFNFRNPPRLFLGKGAMIGGLVYNMGETELNSKIIGHLYTQKFILKAGGGVYANHLIDATISSTKLPDYFCIPPWLEKLENQKPQIISCF
ncbi:MAG: hypothetical protein K0R65_2758 [Crocinitomicaceae bacterium]|jgi:hypothetical protein|nr:hypothetical protein [Crocinitomicaceae bacterium]